MTEFQCLSFVYILQLYLQNAEIEQVLIVRSFRILEESSSKNVKRTVLWLFLGEMQQITGKWLF